MASIKMFLCDLSSFAITACLGIAAIFMGVMNLTNTINASQPEMMILGAILIISLITAGIQLLCYGINIAVTLPETLFQRN